MAQKDEISQTGGKRRFLARVTMLLFVLALAALALAWLNREQIADDLIGDALREAGVEASYTVEQISPELQVLREIVIGDPQRPDFTAERIEVTTVPRFGVPRLGRVRVIDGRLYGSYREGKLSFGALDRLIFTDDEEPFAWPDLDLFVADGRALIESDFGRLGVKLSGAGHLQDGFAGRLAVAAPLLAVGDCKAEEATLYGDVAITGEQPRFSGPLRFGQLACGEAGLADGAAQLDLTPSSDLTAWEGELALQAGAASASGSSAASLGGDGAFSWREGVLTTRYNIAARSVSTPYARFERLGIEGRASATGGSERLEAEGELSGAGVVLGGGMNAGRGAAARAAQGTLAAPLIAKLGGALDRELSGAALAASFTARRSGELTSLVIPEASLRGKSGTNVLSLSRVQMNFTGAGLPRFSGNFVSGGADIPRLAGRMEQAGSGPLQLRMQMDEYAAGEARLAVPEMVISQGQGGRITFAGNVLASGPVPGGFVNGLALPLDGVFAPDGLLALWSGCREARFDRLQVSSLSLGRQNLRLCPQRGAPILRYGAGGLRFAAGIGALDLQGMLGDTPIQLESGPVGVAWPGALAARDVSVHLGGEGSSGRFALSEVSADLSSSGIGGQFTGAEVFLAAVPLDIVGANGMWSFADGQLNLSGADFLLKDREIVDRFRPLTGRETSLSLVDGRIVADAMLYEARRGTKVARVRIMHDLTSAAGEADLTADRISFTPRGLQPRDLSELAYGVVSLVDGEVSGSGRIVWNEAGIASSGQVSSNSLGFAAPFGPVDGASGTVVFTDLLGMTTAPDQQIRLASINPGIAIEDGVVSFQMREGRVVELTGGLWPYLGGTIRMRPVTINIGVAEERAYVIEIEGLEAGRFVENMELNNLAASGVFDGVIPIVFDEMGNGQLIGGILTSREPGGNLSYIGQLTYEDLSYVGNLTFSALRDLKFSHAEILLDGPLTGELVTRVNFDGIGQGATAQGNFITRQVAALPIELRINIRAPFYQLISTTRSLYDPAALRDPRSLGLMTSGGGRLRSRIDQRAVDAELARVAAASQADERAQQPIQPPESEPTP